MTEKPQKLETITKEKIRGIDELLEVVREGGSPDLSSLSAVERGGVLEWYKISQLNEKDQVDFLEEFLRYGLVDDDHALDFIRPMNSVQKKQLGEFIGRTIRPGKYLQCFYECWPEIDLEERQKLNNSLSKDPENIIMVAPFKDLQKVRTGDIKNNSSTRIRKNILESEELNSINEARKLLDALLKYYENHPEIQGHAQKETQEARERGGWMSSRRMSDVRFRRSPFFHSQADNIYSVIDFYLNNKAIVLYPYLEKLVDLGFLSPEQVKPLFELGIKYIPDRTKEEDDEIKMLTNKLKISDDNSFYSASEVAPQGYGLEIEAIQDQGAIRSVETILSNFQEHRKRFGFNHIKFLLEIIDVGAPVFAGVELLGLSRDEVRVLLLRAYQEQGNFFNLQGYEDMKALLEWNRKQKDSGGPDLEKTVIDLLIQNIGEGENARMAMHLRDILPWFEENNRNKIIKVINQKAPHFWLLCLPYAIENRVMPLDELVEKSSQGSDRWFLLHFNNVLYHLSILRKEGKEISLGLEDVKKTARKVILENPYHFLSSEFKYVVNQVFTEEEADLFVSDQLKKEPVDQYFLETLIREDEAGRYSLVCRDILLKRPELFAQAAEHNINRLLSRILSIGDIIHLFIETAEYINFDQVLSDNIVLNLLESPQDLEHLFSVMVRSDNSKGLVALARSLRSVQDKENNDITSWKSNVESLKRELKGLDHSMYHVSESEEKEIRSKIIEKRKELLRLQKNKPQQRLAKNVVEMAKDYESKIKIEIKRFCELEKFLVFDYDILDILDKDAEEFVKRDAEEYVSIHPEILILKYRRYKNKDKHGKLVFQEILGEEEFARLFRSRIRTLSFWSGRHGDNIDTDELSENLSGEVKNTNPLLPILSGKQLEKDFYESVIDILKRCKFYSLYSGQLERMAAEEISIYGPRLEIESFQPRAEFNALARTIFLLETSELALKNKEAILSMPSSQQEEFVNILSFAVLYHLDEDLDFNLGGENYSEVKKKILARILEFTKRLFEIEDTEITISESISIDTIRALSVYYNKSCRENLVMEKAFHQMIAPILSINYELWRNWGVTEVEGDQKESLLVKLKEGNLVPRNISLSQYEKWQEEERVGFSETFTYQMSDIGSGVRDILSLAVADGHIEQEALEVDSLVLAQDYEELMQPIKEMAKRQQNLKKRIKTLSEEEKIEYEELKKQIKQYRDERELDIKRIESFRYIECIRRLSPEELELKSLFIDQKRISFGDAFRSIEETFQDMPDFLSDIRRIRELLNEGNRQIFQGSRVSRSDLTITDRVDPETHVFIGEKPVESCQHYDGSNLNQGLLSYLSDPSIKIIQIWDKNNNIIARSIIRLMEDENQDPQIFMERVYSVNAHPKIKEAMIRFGIQKAKAMGVKIYMQEEEYKDLIRQDMEMEDSVVLHSKGSRSPFTYTDAGGGKVPNGIFKIEIFN